jgi:hypothetical protein
VTRVIPVGPEAFVRFEGTGMNTEGLARVITRNGKLQQDWVFYDALGVFRRLGLVHEE